MGIILGIFGLISNSLGVVSDAINKKRALQQAQIQAHTTAQKIMAGEQASQDAIDIARLYSMREDHKLKLIDYFVLVMPLACAAFFPFQVRFYFDNIQYAIPGWWLAIAVAALSSPWVVNPIKKIIGR